MNIYINYSYLHIFMCKTLLQPCVRYFGLGISFFILFICACGWASCSNSSNFCTGNVYTDFHKSVNSDPDLCCTINTLPIACIYAITEPSCNWISGWMISFFVMCAIFIFFISLQLIYYLECFYLRNDINQLNSIV
jgi:hypothetical protein